MSKGNRIYSIAEVNALFAEALALHAGQSKNCSVLLEKYISEHESKTREYIKRICEGKYHLRNVVGLRERQAIQTVKYMSAILCSECGTDGLLDTLVDTYIASTKKEGLKPIQEDILLPLYDEMAAKDPDEIKANDFPVGKMNTATCAFYFAYYLRYVWVFTDDYEQISNSAVAFASYLNRFLGNSEPRRSERMNYLSKNVAEPFFRGCRTVYDVFNRNMQDCRELLDVLGTPVDCNVRELLDAQNSDSCASMLLASILQSFGIMTSSFFDSKVLTKKDIANLTHIAYSSGLVDDVTEPIEEFWLTGEGNADTKAAARETVIRFKFCLMNAVYETAFCETIKRLTLANIEKAFFSPEGNQLRSELDRIRKQVKRAEDTLAENASVLATETAKTAKAEAAAMEARNKVAGLQSKIEKQQSEIEYLKDQLKKAQARLEEETPQQERPPEQPPEEIQPPEQTRDCEEVLRGIFAGYTVVFVGGNPNIMQKLSHKYPDAVVVPQNRIPTAEQQFTSADVILFKTDSMAHKDYTPVKALAERRGIPYGYLGDITNLSLLEKDIANKLSALLGGVDSQTTL